MHSVGQRNKAGQFQPGVSGNPGGRPATAFAKAIREQSDDGAKIRNFMFAVMDADASILRDFIPTLKERMDAAKFLAERGFGKVPEVEADPFGEVSDDELLAMIQAELDRRAKAKA